MTMVSDKYGRKFSKLRVSLTNECNFACTYCVVDELTGGKHVPAEPKRQRTLSVEEYLETIRAIHVLSPLEAVRLTGGEPLLYHSLPLLIKGIKQLGIPHVSLTTNGYFLETKAAALKESGISSVNISLDAIDQDVFRKMTQRPNINRVLRGIDVAHGIKIPVKVNAVMMRNVNHHQVLPLLEYGLSKNITVRFLELMSMGHLYKQGLQDFYPQDEILAAIQKEYRIKPLKREASATANYWQVEDLGGFGIIANESAPCGHDCNRLRLDSSGKIYGCISNPNGVDIMAAGNNQDTLSEVLEQALLQKQPVKFKGSPVLMRELGG
jgi:GTP 3',8-cyclase